jgi:tetratricopeptide (TPR) repeat protein/DNA-binding transcriptional MerR regulator
MQLFSISELAEEYSIDEDAILFYENKKLLFSGKKRAIGRTYSEFDKFRLKFIINAKNADYAIGNIETLIGKIDPHRPEPFQVKELIEYAESKYKALKKSLAGMDILEQINITCDLELLARYITDVNTLKSRAAISQLSRLKLVKSADEPEPAPISMPEQPIQRETSTPVEPGLGSNTIKHRPRSLYIVLASVTILMIIIYLLAFDGLRPTPWLTSVFKENQSQIHLIQEDKRSPSTQAKASLEMQMQPERSQLPDSSFEDNFSNVPAGDNVSEMDSKDSSPDMLNQTVMERNKEIFAKVYRNLGAADSQNTTASTEQSDDKKTIEPERDTKPMSRSDSIAASKDVKEVSAMPALAKSESTTPLISKNADVSPPAVNERSDSTISEKTPKSPSMAAFMKKITAPPNQPDSSIAEIKPVSRPAPKKAAVDKKTTKSAGKNIGRTKQKTVTVKPDPKQEKPVKQAKPKPDKPTPVQKQPEPVTQSTQSAGKDTQKKTASPLVFAASPSALPPILSSDPKLNLNTELNKDAPKAPAKQPPKPARKTVNDLKTSLPSGTTNLSDLPTDLLDKTSVAKKKATQKNAPAPEVLAWIQKSYNHVVNGEAGEAIVAATVAISFDPNVDSPYINRAWAYSKKGDHDKAIQDCNKALSINPDGALALNNRGLAYQGKGDLDQAERDYEKACKLGLDVACRNYKEITEGNKISRLLGQINNNQVQGNWDTVIRLSTKALGLSPGNVAAYNHRATAYIQKEFFYKAIKDCNDAIKINPKNALSYFNRGNALKQLGNLKVAALDYKKSCDLGLDLGCQNHKEVKAKL